MHVDAVVVKARLVGYRLSRFVKVDTEATVLALQIHRRYDLLDRRNGERQGREVAAVKAFNEAEILWHEGDALGVRGGDVGVFDHADQPHFRSFLETQESLGTHFVFRIAVKHPTMSVFESFLVRFVLLQETPGHVLERSSADEDPGGAGAPGVVGDLAEGDRTGSSESLGVPDQGLIVGGASECPRLG